MSFMGIYAAAAATIVRFYTWRAEVHFRKSKRASEIARSWQNAREFMR